MSGIAGRAASFFFIMGRMAVAAKEGGAGGIRANSVEDIREIKKNVDLPIIGIIKRDYPGCSVRITPTIREVDELMQVKPDVIAVDATCRHPNGRTARSTHRCRSRGTGRRCRAGSSGHLCAPSPAWLRRSRWS